MEIDELSSLRRPLSQNTSSSRQFWTSARASLIRRTVPHDGLFRLDSRCENLRKLATVFDVSIDELCSQEERRKTKEERSAGIERLLGPESRLTDAQKQRLREALGSSGESPPV